MFWYCTKARSKDNIARCVLCIRTKFTSRVLFDITLATTVVGVEGKFSLRHPSTILLSTSVTAQLTGMWPHICHNGHKSETWQMQTLDSCQSGRSVTMYQVSYFVLSAFLYCSWPINVLKPVKICRVLIKSKHHNYSLISTNTLDIGHLTKGTRKNHLTYYRLRTQLIRDDGRLEDNGSTPSETGRAKRRTE